MKRHRKIMLASAAATIAIAGLVVGLAQAGDRGFGPGMGGAMRGPAAMLEQFDADGDRNLSRAEIDAFRDGALDRHDTDGDGELSLDEFSTLWLEVTRPMQVRAFQFFDQDGDGEVTASELDRPVNQLFARRDADGDGVIALDEMRRHGQRGRHRERFEERFDDDDDDS